MPLGKGRERVGEKAMGDSLLDECIESLGMYLGKDLETESVSALRLAFYRAVELGAETEGEDEIPSGDQLVAAVSPIA